MSVDSSETNESLEFYIQSSPTFNTSLNLKLARDIEQRVYHYLSRYIALYNRIPDKMTINPKFITWFISVANSAKQNLLAIREIIQKFELMPLFDKNSMTMLFYFLLSKYDPTPFQVLATIESRINWLKVRVDKNPGSLVNVLNTCHKRNHNDECSSREYQKLDTRQMTQNKNLQGLVKKQLSINKKKIYQSALGGVRKILQSLGEVEDLKPLGDEIMDVDLKWIIKSKCFSEQITNRIIHSILAGVKKSCTSRLDFEVSHQMYLDIIAIKELYKDMEKRCYN